MTARGQPTASNGEPLTIKTLYELVKSIDDKVDSHSQSLAVISHQLSQSCPRNPDLVAALARFDTLASAVENHERRLVIAERVIAFITALWAVLMGVLGKLAYDLLSGNARLIWH